MAKLTADQQKQAKAWLHDVFYGGGLLAPGKCARPKGYECMYNYVHRNARAEIIKASEVICEELRQRGFKFDELDKALDLLKDYTFNTDMTATSVWSSTCVKKPASMLAKYLAWFCAENGIKWDDSARTKYEIEHDRSTIIGRALAEYELFTSQAEQAARARAASASGAAPASNYKSSGSHSGDIPNLIGTPGVKTSGSGAYMFCIIANKIGKNTPSAYITPLKVVGNTVMKVTKAQAMTVKFGSGNGYTDCTLWFDDQIKADAALKVCVSKFGSKYSGFSLAKKRASADYFKVESDLGDAYIKAGKLNEELEDSLKNNPRVAKYGELDEEAYYRYDI